MKKINDCYRCKYCIPCSSEFGLCDIVDDGQTVFAVKVDFNCLFKGSGRELSSEEVKARDLRYKEQQERFRASLIRSSEEIRKWPGWKRNILGGIGYNLHFDK